MNFKTWKTITVGRGVNGLWTPSSIQPALARGGYDSGFNDGLGLFGDYPFGITRRETRVKLVKVSVADLGFTRGVNIWGHTIDRWVLDDILRQAYHEFGLGLCTPEIAVQLRLQYPTQQRNHHIFVGMNIVPVLALFDRWHVIFTLSGKKLGCTRREVFESHRPFVFVKPCK